MKTPREIAEAVIEINTVRDMAFAPPKHLEKSPSELLILAREVIRLEEENKIINEVIDKKTGEGFMNLAAENHRLWDENRGLKDLFIASEDGHEFEMVRLMKEENARLRDACKLVDFTDQSRGYPIGKEWTELVSVIRAALKSHMPAEALERSDCPSSSVTCDPTSGK